MIISFLYNPFPQFFFYTTLPYRSFFLYKPRICTGLYKFERKYYLTCINFT